MVSLFNLLIASCMYSLVPNYYTIRNLPPHQQMYIIKGATKACNKELKTEKFLACLEDKSYCGDIDD